MSLFRRVYHSTSTQIDTIILSHDVRRVFNESKVSDGILQVFVTTGSAGVAIFESDPKIYEEYKKWVEAQFPSSNEKRPERRSGSGRNYAHLRAKLVGTSVQIPIADGKLQWGPWQEVVLFDFDDRVGRREICITVVSSGGGGAAAGGVDPGYDDY